MVSADHERREDHIMPFDRYAILTAHYAKCIADDWNLAAIKAECEANAEPDPDSWPRNSELIGRCFLGTVMNIYPSGKYYMPWCSNQTRADETRDKCYGAAFNGSFESAGMWIESGEGDPCDLFACCHVEALEEEDNENANNQIMHFAGKE